MNKNIKEFVLCISVSVEVKKLKKGLVELLMKLAMGSLLPYGTTRCYLPPDASEHTPA